MAVEINGSGVGGDEGMWASKSTLIRDKVRIFWRVCRG